MPEDSWRRGKNKTQWKLDWTWQWDAETPSGFLLQQKTKQKEKPQFELGTVITRLTDVPDIHTRPQEWDEVDFIRLNEMLGMPLPRISRVELRVSRRDTGPFKKL